ncbi:hypothetical protein B0H19DRAFT_1068392 [Mycena capillaripes]|nr:hypothetical protein B0H19DRAFT_1068392 [Mycena capillaripes]
MDEANSNAKPKIALGSWGRERRRMRGLGWVFAYMVIVRSCLQCGMNGNEARGEKVVGTGKITRTWGSIQELPQGCALTSMSQDQRSNGQTLGIGLWPWKQRLTLLLVPLVSPSRRGTDLLRSPYARTANYLQYMSMCTDSTVPFTGRAVLRFLLIGACPQVGADGPHILHRSIAPRCQRSYLGGLSIAPDHHRPPSRSEKRYGRAEVEDSLCASVLETWSWARAVATGNVGGQRWFDKTQREQINTASRNQTLYAHYL